MNREIKFRAWDPTSKQMIIDGFDGAGSSARIYQLDFQGRVSLTNLYGLDLMEGGAFNNPKDLILMQFTGLKDKEGNEIYEGDVLDYGWKQAVVCWYGEGWIAARLDIMCCEPEHLLLSPYKVYEQGGHAVEFDSILSNQHGSVTIIGNIHENPELLK